MIRNASAMREAAFLELEPAMPDATVSGKSDQIEVDQATPGEWARMLDLFSDANIYQTRSYGLARWGEKHLSHLVLKRDGEVVAMAQLRIVRPANLNCGIAYLRWGPLCHRRGAALDPDIVLRMARALEAEYVYKRRLWLKILPNAFVGSPRSELFETAFSTFTRERGPAAEIYRTLVLDLAPPLEVLRRNLNPKWRNKLAGAEKNGLQVVQGSGVEEYRIFCRLYQQMRNRKSFDTTVDIEEFEKIQQNLPEAQRMQVLICRQEGEPVAGVVASAMGDSAIYLLGATSDNGLKAKGSYLLQWTLIQWLKANGIRWYDLGGIDPERNPGVYQFKNGLSGADVYQLNPLVACNSMASSALVRTSLAVQRWLRARASQFRPASANN